MGILQSAASCSLFQGIEADELAKILRCTGATVSKFEKNETVIRGGQPIPKVGILLSGALLLVHDDAAGNRALLTRLAQNELFGLSLSTSQMENEDLYLCAESNSEVILMDAHRLIDGCEQRCGTHGLLLRNALSLLSNKNLALIRKQCHMARHSQRGKIASYLIELSALSGGVREVCVPFKRQGFADYLGVDRSALCAELSRMKRDGLFDYRLERFTLYDPLFEL